MSRTCRCLGRLLSDSTSRSALRPLRKTKACVPSTAMQISSTAEAQNALALIGRLRSTRIMARHFQTGLGFVDPDADEIAITQLLDIGRFVLDLVRERVRPF